MIFDVEHDARMAHMATDHFCLKLNGYGRYLDRLNTAVNAGIAINFNSVEARSLAADAASLRTMADAIDKVRGKLIDNGTPRLALVA